VRKILRAVGDVKRRQRRAQLESRACGAIDLRIGAEKAGPHRKTRAFA
jgi:hypothetical protein